MNRKEDFVPINSISLLSANNEASVDDLSSTEQVEQTQIKVATFNLFNYLAPPDAFYDFDRIYSAEQWQKKENWIASYLQKHQPDIIGFQ